MGLMKLSKILVLSLVMALCRSGWADVNDTASERVLSLHGSVHSLAIPRDDWVLTKEQRRPGDTAVYYAMASEKRNLNFSVYIDKTSVCHSAESCLEDSMKNPAYKDAKDLKKFDGGKFKGAQFFIDSPKGLPIFQSNVQVSAVIDDVWFDIHISQVGKERPDMSVLQNLLDQLNVK